VNWLDKLLDLLHSFWPLRIVTSYEKGVRFWLGRDTAELSTGIYAFLPWFGDIKIVTVVPDVMDLGVHSITTKDDRTITFSANVAYEITDARAMYTKVQDFATSLSRLAEGHMAAKIREWSYEEMVANQRELERSLERTLNTRAKVWGVSVLDCWLTDLVEARQYRLFGTSPLS
jgi:regulator of protease activity HflC (stomatin/prohibitin superfamily)